MVIYLRAELGYMPDKAALVVRREDRFCSRFLSLSFSVFSQHTSPTLFPPLSLSKKKKKKKVICPDRLLVHRRPRRRHARRRRPRASGDRPRVRGHLRRRPRPAHALGVLRRGAPPQVRDKVRRPPRLPDPARRGRRPVLRVQRADRARRRRDQAQRLGAGRRPVRRLRREDGRAARRQERLFRVVLLLHQHRGTAGRDGAGLGADEREVDAGVCDPDGDHGVRGARLLARLEGAFSFSPLDFPPPFFSFFWGGWVEGGGVEVDEGGGGIKAPTIKTLTFFLSSLFSPSPLLSFFCLSV